MSKLLKEKGIIVRSFKYGESSLILDILTSQHGLKSFIIQSVRKAKSKTSPSSIQLAASVDIDFYLKENADLYQLKEIKVNTIWNSLYSDIRKITMCMFLTELTRKVLSKYENHDEEYIILFNILKDLENNDDNWSLHIWYLLQLQQIQGISILRHPIESGNYFDIVLQQMGNNIPQHHLYFNRDELNMLSEIESLELRQVSSLHITRTEKNTILNKLLEYLKTQIPSIQVINSLDVLKSVFD